MLTPNPHEILPPNATHGGGAAMQHPRIPIIRESRSGRGRVIGLASNMESAERLLAQCAARKPHLRHYIDCSRDAAEIPTDSLGFIIP